MSDEPWPLIGTWWLISRSRIRSPAQVERVKSPIGAGEVLTAVDILMEFHAFSTPAKFVLDGMLDALLDVLDLLKAGRARQKNS
jgi:hypothetical protein